LKSLGSKSLLIFFARAPTLARGRDLWLKAPCVETIADPETAAN
jgi:hypothetical protein